MLRTGRGNGGCDVTKAIPSSLDGMIERIEREAFEKHAIKDQHFGEWAMRSTGGEYENEFVRTAWSSWQARAALASKCRGVAHQGCNYLAPCGSVCDKCGAKI